MDLKNIQLLVENNLLLGNDFPQPNKSPIVFQINSSQLQWMLPSVLGSLLVSYHVLIIELLSDCSTIKALFYEGVCMCAHVKGETECCERETEKVFSYACDF